MPSYRKSTPPPHPDLSRQTETARRWLYDAVERIVFHPEEADPECDPPPYSAEDAGLIVQYSNGRWLAAWEQLEVPSYQPVAMRVAFVRIQLGADTPSGLRLSEV